MSIERESKSAHALNAASSALLVATFALMEAGRWADARAANAAARQVNDACQQACDGILERWWVRLIVRVGDFLTGRMRKSVEPNQRTNR